MIRKVKDGYRIFSRKKNPKTGKRRNLGTFDSLNGAKKHEREIEYFKHHEMQHIKTFEKFDTLNFKIDDVDIKTDAKNQPKIKPVSVAIKTKASQEEVKELLDYFIFELTDKNLHPTKVTGKAGEYPNEGSEYNIHFTMNNGDVLQVYFDGDDVWTLDVNKPDGSNEEFYIDGSDDLQDLLNQYMSDFSKRDTMFQEEEYSPLPKNSILRSKA